MSMLMLPVSSASAITQPHRAPATVSKAAVASPGCKGKVISFTKPSPNYVQLRAQVSCNRVVDRIRVQAFISRGEGSNYSGVVECKNKSACSATVTHAVSKTKTHKYWGGVVPGDVPVTVVWDNGKSWTCYVGITCTYGTANY
ncbi:hypothetical protein [Pimelobacter sp. 30-1]|uniref:hypothetical protein n=1 Tax=Pimelobacter sp. 30-1 TaxID=2004991 RepID=UPI001C056156|nr:hypothetical protein [Pimelobacter sp. 30-1]MBU2698420.1 hypothetical protein [Pimelobacter sp. 30-1]